MNDEHLKKIAELLRETANEVEALIYTRIDTSTPSEKENECQREMKPVEEAFIETAEESGEPASDLPPKTTAEVREIASKAIKAGLRPSVKELISKYGESVSSIGENTPEKLTLLYAELSALMEADNA